VNRQCCESSRDFADATICLYLQVRCDWKWEGYLTPCSTVLLEKLTGRQVVKKFPAFMEPEGSLPHSQQPATCPYPEQKWEGT
jgi:hypothetical protein